MWKDTSTNDNPAAQAARLMLDVFTSVGAERFDVTWTTRQGEKTAFRRHVPASSVRHFLPTIIANAEKNERNLIVRPVSPRAVFIQLDDLNGEGLERVKPAAFLGLQTSPGNYQAWVAMPAGATDKEFVRRLRKGAGADDSASGATRVAGSVNFKDKYAPDFPRVQIAYAAPNLMASVSQLESLGLVTTPAKSARPYIPFSPIYRTRSRKWPSYQVCVQGAPPNRDDTGPDISKADFTWCMTAISWGHGIEETASHLMEESPKARENGERYALMTAQNAAAAVERRERSRA
jgi:hypothetical protein